jgi:serine/threonine protein kinase/WD40 repeat protein/tetratricopeptide (TPR) repeat protein
VDRLAEEFAARFRRGERPSLTEYTQRYPDLAQDIRELFPALVLMEQLKPPADPTGPEGAASGTRLQVLGDYRILREVGRGGMGVVYEAEQVSLGRHVALKVLAGPALVNPTYLERFRREAKAAAKLHHTNIVPVFGVGEHAGVHYYAMQYIAGEGLDRVLHDVRALRQQAPDGQAAAPASGGTVCAPSIAASLLSGHFTVPAEPAPGASDTASLAGGERSTPGLSTDASGGSYYRGVARLGAQAADALAYAHRQGVLHRDIKPSNLLLDAQGTVWVTDFGLAKAEGTDELTQTGDIVGTVRYMAPERFDGHSLPQSDVYGLGLTLYELLTLRPAFEDSNRARLIERVLHEPPLSPRKVDPRIPRDLETVVLKCLAKEPAERYATAEALAEDLRRFLGDRPIKARRTPWHERTWRWCRRNPAVAVLLAAVAGLLLAVATVSTLSSLKLRAALTKTQAAERQARLREAEALVGQAHGIRYSRQMGQRFDALAALGKAAAIGRELGQPPGWFDQPRSEAAAALALPDVEVVRQWDAGPPEGGFDFDGARERYARSDQHGNVSVRRVANDAEIVALPGSGSAADARLSPDGHWLAVYDPGTTRLKVWRLTDPAPVLIHEGADVTRGGLDFSPDNQRLLYIHRDSRITIVTLADGQVVRWPARGTGADGPQFRPDGSQVMFHAEVDGQFTVLICDVRTGAVAAKLPHPSGVSGSAWHPGGRMLATCCDDLRIRLWETTAWQQTLVLEGHTREAVRCTFTPDGDQLLSNDSDCRLRFWDVHSGRLLFITPMSLEMLHFGPHGLLPLRDGNQLRLLRVATGHEFRTLTLRRRGDTVLNVRSAALSPDGRLLAVGTEDGVVLWDAAHGSEVGFVGYGLTACVAFEPSGALLTNGPSGLGRWPVREDPAAPERLRLGPPEELPVPGSDRGIAISRDGGLVASAQGWGALVLHRDHPAHPVRLYPHGDARSVTVSPDGSWVATANLHGRLVKVWEARTGKLATTLPVPSGSSVLFSPEGRWLAITTDKVQLWAVGSWKEGPSFEGGQPTFSPDGKVLALETGRGVIRLLDVDSGREHARLEDPNHDRARSVFFSADGTQLVVPTNDSQTVHVWDLRKVRAGLSALGLDWDAPPYPPAPAGARPPLRLHVDLGDLEEDLLLGTRPTPEYLSALVLGNSLMLACAPFDFKACRRRGRAYGALGMARPAIADYSTALALLPADDLRRIDLLRRRAVNYLSLGEDDKALADIRRAEQVDPARGPSLRTSLASVLLQRAARRTERAAALVDLRKALEIRDDYALTHNNLAWLLLKAPQEPGAVQEALRHARQAVDLAADQPHYLNTLGVALYRSGQAAEAVPVLEKSLAAGEGLSDAFDLFFLAMCHARLGDAAKAKDCFDRAVKWCDERNDLPPDQAGELNLFRAEAEALLPRRP